MRNPNHTCATAIPSRSLLLQSIGMESSPVQEKKELEPTISSVPPEPRAQPLLIPDILDHIFEQTTNGHLTKAALVCKTWSDVALDFIWRDVKLFSLLKLIYPLNRLDEGWDFKSDETIGKGNWDRFRSYCNRVITLSHNDSTEMDSHDSLISYQMMVLLLSHQSTIPGSVLLPKAKKITWIAKRDRTPLQLIPWISPTVKDLSIQLSSSVTADSTRRFLFMLSTVQAMKTLRTFHFETKLDAEGDLKFSDALATCLNNQDSVELLRLDECYVSNAVTSVVGNRPKLLDVRALVTPLTGDEFEKLAKTMVMTFPKLQRLQLLVPAAFTEPTEEKSFRDRIQPLLECTGLLEFQLYRRHATVLTAADIQAMGRAWPKMEVLNINANVENGQEDGRGTPFRLLEEFAACFGPALKELAHYYTFDEPVAAPEAIAHKFPHLKILGVGNSPLPDEKVEEVGAYVTAICPPATLLASSDNGNYRQTVFRTEWNGANGKQNWVSVKLLVAMERRMTAMYQTKVASAAKETELLKGRVTTLESNFATFRPGSS